MPVQEPTATPDPHGDAERCQVSPTTYQPRHFEPGQVVRCIKTWRSRRLPNEDFGQEGRLYIVAAYYPDQNYLTLHGLRHDLDPTRLALLNAERFELVEGADDPLATPFYDHLAGGSKP